jgi:hypothetical protein
VVHHALVQVIEPLFEKKFIHHSYACRVGKGTHAAVLYQQNCLKKANAKWDRAYVLKADISKYFPSINHRVLYKMLQRTIRDKNVLWLCATIIRHGGANGYGIPVGALTSQLFANIYLDKLDHYLKDQLGVEYYVRYMDDWVIIGPNKQYLHRILAKAEFILGERLKLTLNPKTQIFPASHGVDFCGYRIWNTHLLPRKKNIKRTKQRFRKLSNRYSSGLISLKDIRPYVMSFLGYMKRCSGYRTTIMKVLVACEFSGRVRDAFIKKGHDAVSCDLLPSESTAVSNYQGDVFDIINDGWDLMIAHPPCTYLAVSGNRSFLNNPERWKNRLDAMLFVHALMNADIEKICIDINGAMSGE